jgi:hypothetical protein
MKTATAKGVKTVSSADARDARAMEKWVAQLRKLYDGIESDLEKAKNKAEQMLAIFRERPPPSDVPHP